MNISNYARGIFAMLPFAARPLVILGGGALRAAFDGTKVKDYDLFFRDELDYLQVAVILAENGWREVPSPGRTREFIAPNGARFNLVGFAWGTPQQHVGRFDFRCTAMAAWYEGPTLHFHADEGAIEDAGDLILVVRNNNGTDRTMQRIVKYLTEYGYELFAGGGYYIDCDDLMGEQHRLQVRAHVESLPRPTPSGGY